MQNAVDANEYLVHENFLNNEINLLGVVARSLVNQ